MLEQRRQGQQHARAGNGLGRREGWNSLRDPPQSGERALLDAFNGHARCAGLVLLRALARSSERILILGGSRRDGRWLNLSAPAREQALLYGMTYRELAHAYA